MECNKSKEFVPFMVHPIIVAMQPLQDGVYVYQHLHPVDCNGTTHHQFSFGGGDKKARHELLVGLRKQTAYNVRIWVRFSICQYSKYDFKFPTWYIEVEDAIILNGYKED